MTFELDPDSELPPHLLSLFLNSAPTQLALLEKAASQRNVDSARLAAHKFKGGLYAAGASALARDVEALRGALGKQDFATVERQLTAIRNDFARLVATLQGKLERVGP